MAYKIPARLDAIRLEANRLSPHRRLNSDGTVGDPRHFANGGDHVPEPDPGTTSPLVVHAIDIGQSMPGTAYFQPGMGLFDVWAYSYQIAHAYIAATDAVRRQKWPWLHPSGGGYIVWGDPRLGHDVIFNPSHDAVPYVRQNVGTGREHIDAPHSHFSIGHNAQSENDTQPIFTGAASEDDDVNDQDKKDIANQAGVVASRAVIAALPDLMKEALKEYVDHLLGGYPDGVHYEDRVLLEDFTSEARKARGLAKKS